MLEGKIERQGFLDIIQLLTMSRKSGRLEIKGNAEGILFFSDGELLDCTMNSLAGDEAFIELFILVAGNFNFHEEKLSKPKVITKSLTDLLMEASKQATEWDSASLDLPFEDAVLYFAETDPNKDITYTFSALEWAIVSKINGRRSLVEIARILKQPKTKTAIILAKFKKAALISTEDEESALLRSVFRKTAEIIYHLMDSRVKPKARDRIYTEFNRWSFSKGFDIRILDGEGVINNIPYDLPIDEKRLVYRQTLEQIHDSAQSGLNRTELADHMTELFERLSDMERKAVAESGLGKFLGPSERKGGPDFWEAAGQTGGADIIPR